jgi:hypothetical protein
MRRFWADLNQENRFTELIFIRFLSHKKRLRGQWTNPLIISVEPLISARFEILWVSPGLRRPLANGKSVFQLATNKREFPMLSGSCISIGDVKKGAIPVSSGFRNTGGTRGTLRVPLSPGRAAPAGDLPGILSSGSGQASGRH